MLKISLLIIGMISLIFILTFGTGMVLIAIGFALCFGSAYYHGISNHEYKDGYSKGFNAGIEYIIDWAKNKKEG